MFCIMSRMAALSAASSSSVLGSATATRLGEEIAGGDSGRRLAAVVGCSVGVRVGDDGFRLLGVFGPRAGVVGALGAAVFLRGEFDVDRVVDRVRGRGASSARRSGAWVSSPLLLSSVSCCMASIGLMTCCADAMTESYSSSLCVDMPCK